MLLGMAKKNQAAVELGRKGGKARVPKGFGNMDPEEKKRIQSEGGKASAAKRWAKKKAAK